MQRLRGRGDGKGRGMGRRAVVSVAALVALITIATCGPADAVGFEFRADDLRIFRSGASYFADAFEAGGPQLAPGGFLPSVENPAGADGSYFVAGTPTESASRLVLNHIGAAGPGLFTPVRFELALLETPTTDPGTGLNIDTSFAIFSRWDLIPGPDGIFSAFEMGLTDGMGTILGDDRVNVGVLRFPDDTREIAFRAQDPFAPDNFLTLGVHALTPADFVPGRQIDLALVKAAEGDSPITAFWRFVDGAVPLPTDLSGFNALPGSRDIYNDGEGCPDPAEPQCVFTRVQLNGFADPRAVPLPPSLLLLALAAMVGLVGRRRAGG